jgi:hypothetical protein
MGAVVCDYILDDARNQHDLLTMNRQDGQLQFYIKHNILRFYAHGQLCFEQAEVAVAWGTDSRNGWKPKSLVVISTGVASAIQGLWLIA